MTPEAAMALLLGALSVYCVRLALRSGLWTARLSAILYGASACSLAAQVAGADAPTLLALRWASVGGALLCVGLFRAASRRDLARMDSLIPRAIAEADVERVRRHARLDMIQVELGLREQRTEALRHTHSAEIRALLANHA